MRMLCAAHKKTWTLLKLIAMSQILTLADTLNLVPIKIDQCLYLPVLVNPINPLVKKGPYTCIISAVSWGHWQMVLVLVLLTFYITT